MIVKNDLQKLESLATKGAIIKRVCLDENGKTAKYEYGCPTEATLIIYKMRSKGLINMLWSMQLLKKMHLQRNKKI